MIRTAPERVLTACCALACCFTLFSFRLVHLQVARHEELSEKATVAHGTRQTIYARRGNITDIRGVSLAQNEPVKTVVIDASLVKDLPKLGEILASTLEMPLKTVQEKLERTTWSEKEQAKVPSRYIVIKKDVAEDVSIDLANKVREADLRGLMFEQETIRVYPNGEMACHVIGYTNNKGDGMEGVERSMNDQLKARDGYRVSERDRKGREMVQFRGIERPPENGANVQLTIDSGLQMIVESELDAGVKKYKPQMATAIMMRPKTGEVLAMATWPNYNLNQQAGVPEENRKNHAIMDQLEPGSTFKIVPAGAALSLGLVKSDTYIFCENGRFLFHGKPLKDHKPLGSTTVHNILVHSSNIGSAKLGIQLGEQRLFEYMRKYGFGERTGINLPGEVPGTVLPPSKWDALTISRVPMGHSVDVTPIQIVTAMSVIANGGLLMTPQIIHQSVDSQTKEVVSYQPVEVRRVISEKAAADVREALVGVVSGKGGTAKKAHVPGFLVGGKTGTAQKPKVGGRGYENGKYLVSFVGFLPAQNPEFVCLVMFDDAKVPHNLNYGGQVAAPVFANIADRAARHLNLTPTEPILPNEAPGRPPGASAEVDPD